MKIRNQKKKESINHSWGSGGGVLWSQLLCCHQLYSEWCYWPPLFAISCLKLFSRHHRSRWKQLEACLFVRIILFYYLVQWATPKSSKLHFFWEILVSFSSLVDRMTSGWIPQPHFCCCLFSFLQCSLSVFLPPIAKFRWDLVGLCLTRAFSVLHRETENNLKSLCAYWWHSYSAADC